MTYEECLAALGKQTGIAFRVKAGKEIPQDLYESGFIEHTRSPIYSFTEQRDIRQYKTVIFDEGPLKGKEFEFGN